MCVCVCVCVCVRHRLCSICWVQWSVFPHLTLAQTSDTCPGCSTRYVCHMAMTLYDTLHTLVSADNNPYGCSTRYVCCRWAVLHRWAVIRATVY